MKSAERAEGENASPSAGNDRRLKVLVSAYACEPGKGSEPAVGWNQAREIAKFHDVWVITRANNRRAIEKALSATPIKNLHWIYCEVPPWLGFWKKGMRGLRLYYYLWQMNAFIAARKHHRNIRFDIVHHVTFVTYWQPTFLHFLSVPFVWGPVGGGESTPVNFLRSFGLRGAIYEILRIFARTLGELDPFVRGAGRRSSAALATTEQTGNRLRQIGCNNVSVVSAIGLPREELAELGAIPYREDGPFRVLTVGRLLHWKGIAFALRAFARFHAAFPESEYWLVGDGSDRKYLERLARELGLGKAVSFFGELPRKEALAKYRDCNTLLFPSFHDSGGGVCLEAMAAGRPVICLDLGGPGLQVTSGTGIKVSAIDPQQVIADLASAMGRLATDRSLCRQLGANGRSRVECDFSWERKGENIAALYTRLATT